MAAAGLAITGGCGGDEEQPPSARAPVPAAACGPTAGPKSPRIDLATAFATVETEPVPNRGDAADDAAVWVHPDDPARSVVIGTDKKGGIAVYDLAGRELQYLSDGDTNNVDLRCGFRLGGRPITLVTAGNVDRNEIVLYGLDPVTRALVAARARPLEPDLEVYGSCMYRSARTGAVYVFATSKEGEMEQWRLRDDGRGTIAGERVRRLSVGSQTEGCVADDRLGHLYVGEEDRGVWKYGAEPEAGTLRTLVDESGDRGRLVADVEGLTILYGPGTEGYLVVSSQGDSSFAVYERSGNNSYVGRFEVAGGTGVDGVADTDGIDGVAVPLGRPFPGGVLVVQDGRNDDGNQNFKLVPLPRPE